MTRVAEDNDLAESTGQRDSGRFAARRVWVNGLDQDGTHGPNVQGKGRRFSGVPATGGSALTAGLERLFRFTALSNLRRSGSHP